MQLCGKNPGWYSAAQASWIPDEAWQRKPKWANGESRKSPKK
jgi:hypothetical protein